MQVSTHEIYVLIASLFAGGVGVSLVAQFIKKVAKMQTDHLIHLMVLGVTGIAAAAQYIIQYHSKLPASVLGVSTASIYGFSQLVFKYSKYTNGFLSKVYSKETGTTTETTSAAPVASVSEPSAATSDTPTFAAQ